jgi:hypothetical protein
LEKTESNSLIQRGIKVVIVVSQVLSHLVQPSARVMQARIEGPSVSGRKTTPFGHAVREAVRCTRYCGTEEKPTACAFSFVAFVTATNWSPAWVRLVDVAGILTDERTTRSDPAVL